MSTETSFSTSPDQSAAAAYASVRCGSHVAYSVLGSSMNRRLNSDKASSTYAMGLAARTRAMVQCNAATTYAVRSSSSDLFSTPSKSKEGVLNAMHLRNAHNVSGSVMRSINVETQRTAARAMCGFAGFSARRKSALAHPDETMERIEAFGAVINSPLSFSQHHVTSLACSSSSMSTPSVVRE